jgi:hypothetical protein
MDGLAKKYGVSVATLNAQPGNVIAIKKARVGLYRPWAPSIDEGWTGWILENYGFEPKGIYKRTCARRISRRGMT